MMKRDETYTTLDAYQAGFLTLKGYMPKLVDQGGKIVFVFSQTGKLLQALADYNAGAAVEASRFAFVIKTLKSQIHSMRNMRREKEKGKELWEEGNGRGKTAG